MTDLAVIRATFADWRTVKTRKQLQLILEVPLEQQGDVLMRLGAPDPTNPRWVAVALLAAPSSPPKAVANAERSEKGKERYRESDKMQQAATRAVMLCKDGKFQQWFAEIRDVSWLGTKGDEYCSTHMRDYLRVTSRRDIANDERAYNDFIALETAYKQAVGQFAEERG